MNSTNIVRRKLSQNVLNRLQLFATTSTTQQDIKIPMRVERGPTDILQALEKTITKDPTAPHYKYHDDPYLIPTSKYEQRAFALSRESGRKAAKWVREEHYDLFQHKVADPMIPAFVPDPPIDEENEITEEILKQIILKGNVEKALKGYDLLERNVSVPVKQALLEMLCNFNQPSNLVDDLPENNWFTSLPEKRIWQDKEEINELFEFLKDQEDKNVAAAAYSAMICGTAKHFDADKAWMYYHQCKAKKLPLNINAFNLLISRIPLREKSDKNCHSRILELLNEMNQQELCPNSRTFNACLIAVANMQSSYMMMDLTKTFFREFKRIGIEPSLTSYIIALDIFKASNVHSALFMQILNALERKMPPVQDIRDTYFFKTAMESVHKDLCNLEIAHRLHNLLLSKDNYKLMGGQFKEITYYRSYMLIVLAVDSIKSFQEFYRNIVPHQYIPEPSLMITIILALEPYHIQDIQEFMLRLWSDICQFKYGKTVGHHLLRLMRNSTFPPDSPMREQCSKAAWEYWQLYIAAKDKSNWELGNLNNILLLLARGNEPEKLTEILKICSGTEFAMPDELLKDEIEEIIDLFISNGYTDGAFVLLDYAIKNDNVNAGIITKKIQEHMHLSISEEKKLNHILTQHSFNLEIPKNE